MYIKSTARNNLILNLNFKMNLFFIIDNPRQRAQNDFRVIGHIVKRKCVGMC